MKITVKNITEEYPKLNIELPEPLAIDKFEGKVVRMLPLYDKNETIKKYIDTFVAKLNAIAAKEQKPAPEKKTKQTVQDKEPVKQKPKKTYKPRSAGKDVPKPKLKAKTTKKSTCQKQGKEKINHYPEDIRLIRRFAGCLDKQRQSRSVMAIYRDMERRITEQKVNSESPFAELLSNIHNRLTKAVKVIQDEKLVYITIKTDEKLTEKVKNIVNSQEIRPTINLIKRFIGIEGDVNPARDKVKRIAEAFANALQKGRVCESDPYWKEFNEANSAMLAFLKGDTNIIAVSPSTLKGLEGIGDIKKFKASLAKTVTGLGSVEPVQFEPENDVIEENFNGTDELIDVDIHSEDPTELNGSEQNELFDGLNGFTPITAQTASSNFEKLNLRGDLGRFLGYVERYEYSILLRGEKGAGKTRLLYQIMNLFALHGLKVGCFSLEIGKNSNIVTDMRNEYLSPKIADSVLIADRANSIEDIKNAAGHFDVVCIDSWGKIPGVKSEDFDSLRKEFPKTIFVIIFQSTTNGTARGGSMPEYDAGIVIQVDRPGVAYCEKNRYNGEDLKYLVFQKRLQEENE